MKTDYVIRELQDSQTQKIYRMLESYRGAFNLGSPELLQFVQDTVIEGIEGDSVKFISLKTLMSIEDSVVQRPIMEAKVLTVLYGEFGLLFKNPLINPIVVGTDPMILESGRHRIAAILFILTHLGLEDFVDKFVLPCFVLKSNPVRIILSNKSRGCTAIEGASIKHSSEGVNVESPSELITQYFMGGLSGSQSKQLSDALRMISVALVKDKQLDHKGLSDETIGAYCVAFFNDMKGYRSDFKYLIKSEQFLESAILFCVEHIPESHKAVQNTGVTNFSRATNSMGGACSVLFRIAIDNGSFVLPKEFSAIEETTRVKGSGRVKIEPEKPNRPKSQRNSSVRISRKPRIVEG
jgi:hypothetical protein